jgi:hypothetical protein
MRGVEMRMTNHNRLQPAFLVNKIDGWLVKEGDQVPEDVAVGGLQEDGALAYAELFARRCAVGQAGEELGGGLGLGGDEVDAGIVGVGLEVVFLGGEGGVEGGPGLAVGGDVLAGVLGWLVLRSCEAI